MHKTGRTKKRRRKEGKTDYKAKISLLKSGKARAVFRKTNRYIIGQIVKTDVAQDRVIVGISSKNLLSLGWPENMKGKLKSLAACYLTGYMLGKKTSEKEVVLDIGFHRNIKKSRIYAFLKGLFDSGIKVSFSEEVLPSEEAIKGEKKDIFDKVKENIS